MEWYCEKISRWTLFHPNPNLLIFMKEKLQTIYNHIQNEDISDQRILLLLNDLLIDIQEGADVPADILEVLEDQDIRRGCMVLILGFIGQAINS
jgi:hypothetical protein